MSEKDKYVVPTGSKGDVAQEIVKAAISAAPLVGGPAAEIFGMVIAPPLQRRQAAWMEEIAEGLKQLEGKVEGFKIENLKENEQFVSTVLAATQAAIRTHQQEKREALRNAVLNVAVGSGLDQDAEAIFLSLIDRYTAWHLRILRLFQNPLELGAAKGQRPENYYIGGSRARLLEAYYPDMQGQRQFYDITVSDLHAQGLLAIQDLQTMVTAQGMFQKATTDWGDRFLAFITAPV
jgi:hypothetical protein